MSLIRYAPALVAGSAISGFGFAIGRDVYRQTKKYWPVMVILACLVGVYYAGVWLFRNYRTAAGTIFKKLGALIVLVTSCIIIYATARVAIGLVSPEIALMDMNGLRADPAAQSIVRWVTIAQITLFLLGALVGMRHRGRRRLAWEAETHNEAFLSEQGLEVVGGEDDDGLRLRDHAQGVGYRLMDNLTVAGELEFMALGRRNKRGYMHYDETGKYTAWSGLSEIR